MNISDLKPYPKNAKIHDRKQIDLIAKSIKQFGFRQPIVIDKNKEIIIGHARLEAAKKLGMTDVPVIDASDLTEKQVKALRLADNKLAELAKWDMKLAIEELKGLDDEMIELTGFDKDLLIEGNEKDDIIPENAPTICKLGDIWQLGRHRLMCGDSTKKEDVEKLMNGQKADMVFTDPPYSILGSSTGFVQDINLIIPFFRLWIPNLIYFTNGDIYICCDWRTYPLIQSFSNQNLKLKNCIVWYKMSGGLGNAYQNAYEFLTYFRTKRVNKIKETNVWEIKREKETGHYAQKPIEYISRAIKNSSKKEEIILDLFLGSGSTLIACEKTNRICYGMELDEHYCDVIIKRFEEI